MRSHPPPLGNKSTTSRSSRVRGGLARFGAPETPPLVFEGQVGLSTFWTSFWITFTEKRNAFWPFRGIQSIIVEGSGNGKVHKSSSPKGKPLKSITQKTMIAPILKMDSPPLWGFLPFAWNSIKIGRWVSPNFISTEWKNPMYEH